MDLRQLRTFVVVAEAGGFASAHEHLRLSQPAASRQIQALEAEMKSAGAWVFSGRLHDADTATVVRVSGGEVLTTDGPFAESKEHLGGFYIIEAEDIDAALSWAAKTADCVKRPIEVRPFWQAPGA